jgi:predicted nuclease of predicted toxin-antitoxin system
VRVLLDTCVWKGVRDALAAADHDVVWAGDWDEDPGDEEILQWAHREGRILVTLDKGFGEKVIVQSLPHHGIIRLVGLSTSEQVAVALRLLARYRDDLAAAAILTAESNRVRIRRP